MDSGTVSGIVTVVVGGGVIGSGRWGSSPGNKDRFEDAGRLPFEEDDAPAQQGDKQ
jgi:cytochrome c oxidase cbb3-type subunit 4